MNGGASTPRARARPGRRYLRTSASLVILGLGAVVAHRKLVRPQEESPDTRRRRRICQRLSRSSGCYQAPARDEKGHRATRSHTRAIVGRVRDPATDNTEQTAAGARGRPCGAEQRRYWSGNPYAHPTTRSTKATGHSRRSVTRSPWTSSRPRIRSRPLGDIPAAPSPKARAKVEIRKTFEHSGNASVGGARDRAGESRGDLRQREHRRGRRRRLPQSPTTCPHAATDLSDGNESEHGDLAPVRPEPGRG